MKVLCFSTRELEEPYIKAYRNCVSDLRFTESCLSTSTVEQASGFEIVSLSTGDDASAEVINKLADLGVRFITIRSTGHEQVDLIAAHDRGIRVANVPGYAPHAIAEHAVLLMLAINRRLIEADRQVHRHDFRINNLLGFDLHGKKVGIVGTGLIGSAMARILHGFGCRLLASDTVVNEALIAAYGVSYVSLETLCSQADIITLHLPLNEKTYHLFNRELFNIMKEGVMIVNTGSGACVKTSDLLAYLDTGQVGSYGADVYEYERGVFFYDRSDVPLNDTLLAQLLERSNVLITPHQAFATREALCNIAKTTFHNIYCWEHGRECENELSTGPGYFTLPSANRNASLLTTKNKLL